MRTSGNTTFPDGLNYYSNDHVDYHGGGEPGQTFTTGTSSTGYVLTSIAVKTAGLGSYSGIGSPASYYLHIYTVSSSAATLVQTYTASVSPFNDGDWLQWINLSVPMAPNASYAWSFGLTSNSGYEAMAVASRNRYSGGQIALIPVNGGTMTFGSSGNYDAVFVVGLSTSSSQLLASAPTISPASVNYPDATITLGAAGIGSSPPYHYQWQTDGGGGGALTNILDATNANLVMTLTNTGRFRFDYIVTNATDSATSSVVTVTVLSPPSVTVDASQPMAAMPSQGIGVCTAVYNGDLIDPNVAPMLSSAGIKAVRYPGGSYADIFNWQNTTVNAGGYIAPNDSFDNFMNTVVNPAGAQAIITVNYGSNPTDTAGGDPAVAAAWVAYANVTNHWGIKYWEIGNEVGGNGYYGTNLNWEYDLHYPETNAATRVGQPALSPAAYGTNSIQFITEMKAKDPSISCGVGFDAGNSAYNSQLLGVCGSYVDFVIIHYYPGTDAASLLAASAGIPATVHNTYTQLTNDVGAAHASQMKILVTETGAGNVTGAPVSLYTADNYLTWIENGVVNVDYQILHNDMLTSSQQPGHAYYGAMMASLLANVGDTFLKTTSSQPLVRVHATERQDGKIGVMLVNTDPQIPIPVDVSIINGMTLSNTGIAYQFGLSNFIGSSDTPSYPVSSNVVSGLGNRFTISVPPYTMIDLLIPFSTNSTNTPPVLAGVGDQTVNVGQMVAFTASATDADQPPQSLSFRLLAGAPNATLDSTSGAFSWRPLVAQADSTNLFTLEVTDNGTPPRSATQSFKVLVNPLVRPAVVGRSLSGGGFIVQVTNTLYGPDYTIQVSTNLQNWSTLFMTNLPNSGFAQGFEWMNTNASKMPEQFYRIQVGPSSP